MDYKACSIYTAAKCRVFKVNLQVSQTKTIGVMNNYVARTSLERAQMWKLLEQVEMVVVNNWV